MRVVTSLSVLATLCLLAPSMGCSTCAYGDFSPAECRVAAEHTVAQTVVDGVTLRFQDPAASTADRWDALGVFWVEDGAVHARPSTLVDFAISVDPGDSGLTELAVVLHNVGADAALVAGPPGAEAPLDSVADGLRRDVVVPLGGAPVFVRGSRPCGSEFRLAVAGDVQTNPDQLEQVLLEMGTEATSAAAAGQPLMGFVLLGDLAEDPVEDELTHVLSVLERSPVPVSVVPGNHDVHGDELALYNRIFGAGTYAQGVCSARLALMDTGTGDLAASVQARIPSLFARPDYDFLVVGGHYPAWPGRTGNGWGDEDAAWYMLTEMVRNEADMYISGHYHSWEEMPRIAVGPGEVHQIISGTAGGDQGAGAPRYGFTRLTFTGAGMQSCFVDVQPLEAASGPSGVDIIRVCP